MSNPVRILTWIFLLAKSYGLNVTLISSSGSTSYYRGDVISLTCSYMDVPANAVGFELRFNSAALGCTYGTNPSAGFYLYNKSYTGALTSPTGSICHNLTTLIPTAYNLAFTFTLTESGNYTCHFGALGGAETRSSPLQLSLREKPGNNNLYVSPSVVFAGDQVTVQCLSTGGNPPSRFTYSVGADPIPSGAFTATRRLHGMLLSCVDIIHSPYLGNITSVTTSESSLSVYYVEANTYENTPCANETVLFQVMSYLPVNITPAYSWTKDSQLLNVVGLSYTANYINSSNQTYGNSLNETYTCTVTGLPYGPRNVTFIISWDTSATCVISTTTTSSDSAIVEDAQQGLKIGLGVGLGVGIPVIIVLIVLLVYLKKNGHETVNKENRNPTDQNATSTDRRQEAQYEELASGFQAINLTNQAQHAVDPYEFILPAARRLDDHPYDSIRQYENLQ